MSFLTHRSAKPSHYDKAAKHYDAFNEKNSDLINGILKKALKKYKVKTILDLACGTGSQVFSLINSGYEVIGVDINSKMLNIAKNIARKEKLDVNFFLGDMRTLKVGEFDAVITIFNAIGHLTKLDFEKTMQNVYRNLKVGGIYVFDIFNLSYLNHSGNITKLTIDWEKTVDGVMTREIQYSTISEEGVLSSYSTFYIQKDSDKPKKTSSTQTLQVYSAKQLREMLLRNGFDVLSQSRVDGSEFSENETERILTIAKKS